MDRKIEITLHYRPPTIEEVADTDGVYSLYNSIDGPTADFESGAYLRKYWRKGNTNLVAWFRLPDDVFEPKGDA